MNRLAGILNERNNLSFFNALEITDEHKKISSGFVYIILISNLYV